MKIAILSDLHANLRAVDACLAHARAQQAAQFAVLGDIVGYGAEPGAVVSRVMELARAGAWVVRGNHDDMAVQPPTQAATQDGATAGWTHSKLDAAQREWLAALPLTVHIGPVLLVHASADAPASWRYVDSDTAAGRSLEGALALDSSIRYVVGGHVHHQRLYYRGTGRHMMPFAPTPGVPVPVPSHRHWVATAGSVGQPRDGRTEACYAMLDLAQHKLTFHRVAYDHVAAARAVREAGLGDALARRLLEGR